MNNDRKLDHQDGLVSDSLERMKKFLKLSQGEFDDIQFLSTVVFYCESNLEKIASVIAKNNLKSSLAETILDIAFRELTFMAKVKIVERIMEDLGRDKDAKKYLKFCRNINSLRNDLFHNKLKKLKYKEKDISEEKTKIVILKDMVDGIEEIRVFKIGDLLL